MTDSQTTTPPTASTPGQAGKHQSKQGNGKPSNTNNDSNRLEKQKKNNQQQQQQQNGKPKQENNNKNNNRKNNNYRNKSQQQQQQNGNGVNGEYHSSPEPEIKEIKEIKEIIPKLSEDDIIIALEENNYDKTKTVDQLLAEEEKPSWSEVIKKKVKPGENDHFNPNNQNNRKSNKHQNNSDRQIVLHDQQLALVQSPDICSPEQVMNTVSKKIDEQLKEIQSKTLWLMSLKKELDEISTEGKEKLNDHLKEKQDLKIKEASLLKELEGVRQRMKYLDDEINRIEKDKSVKLNHFIQGSKLTNLTM